MNVLFAHHPKWALSSWIHNKVVFRPPTPSLSFSLSFPFFLCTTILFFASVLQCWDWKNRDWLCEWKWADILYENCHEHTCTCPKIPWFVKYVYLHAVKVFDKIIAFCMLRNDLRLLMMWTDFFFTFRQICLHTRPSQCTSSQGGRSKFEECQGERMTSAVNGAEMRGPRISYPLQHWTIFSKLLVHNSLS